MFLSKFPQKKIAQLSHNAPNHIDLSPGASTCITIYSWIKSQLGIYILETT